MTSFTAPRAHQSSAAEHFLLDPDDLNINNDYNDPNDPLSSSYSASGSGGPGSGASDIDPTKKIIEKFGKLTIRNCVAWFCLACFLMYLIPMAAAAVMAPLSLIGRLLGFVDSPESPYGGSYGSVGIGATDEERAMEKEIREANEKQGREIFL